MRKVIFSLGLVLMTVFFSKAQFISDSTQSTANGPSSPGNGAQPPQTDVLSPTQRNNSPFFQNGILNPPLSNFPTNQNGFNTFSRSSFPSTQNDVSSTTQTNLPNFQSGFNSPTKLNFPSNQNNVVSTTQSSLPFSQNSLNSPTQPIFANNKNGFNSPVQTNISFAQSDSSLRTQSNFPSSQNVFNSPNQSNLLNKSNLPTNQINPPNQSNLPVSQNEIFSTQQSNLPSAKNDFFSPSQSVFSNIQNDNVQTTTVTQNSSFPTTQASSTFILSGGFSQLQTGAPPTPPNTQPIESFSSTPANSVSSIARIQSDSQSIFSPPTSAPITPMQFTLATMLAGQYSNEEQYQDETAKGVTGPNKHPSIQVSYIPVIIPHLFPAVTMYYEQRTNNSTQPVRQAIYCFTQESSCSVRMTTYDIANASRFSVTSEGLQALEKLTSIELQNRPACDAFWELIEKDLFTSYLSTDQCTFEVAGGVMVRPSGSRNLTCTGMTFTEVWRQVRNNQIVGGSVVPYIFKKTGNIYPVPVGVFSANSCFKVPCAASGSSQSSDPGWSEIKSQMSYTRKDSFTQSANGI